MNQLTTFFATLCADPYLQDAFACDPEQVMDAAGLAPEAKDLLRACSRPQLAAALHSGSFSPCVASFDPGDDPLVFRSTMHALV